jgi:hypothetical protein
MSDDKENKRDMSDYSDENEQNESSIKRKSNIPTNTAKMHCQSKNSSNFGLLKDGGLVNISNINVIRKFRDSDYNMKSLLISTDSDNDTSRTSNF